MLIHGDCLKLMPTLGDKSVDMVLVDLPYGQTACAWDCEIDLAEMWGQLKRICKPNANIVFFTTTKFGYQLIKSNEKWFRSDLVWEKPNIVGFLSAKKMVLRKHEMIYLFGKPSGGGKTYNPQKRQGINHRTFQRMGLIMVSKMSTDKNINQPILWTIRGIQPRFKSLVVVGKMRKGASITEHRSQLPYVNG
jgi:hypothetical protein